MSALLLNDVQKSELSIQPVSAAGNPARVDGVPQWRSSDDTVLVVTAAEDGLSAVITTTGKLGTAQVSVTADADLGEGVKPISGVLDVEVQASEAVGLTIAAAAPTAKE